jgi:DNA polymerase I-like protein with 3'-5' exonuclease and polymerase domains
VFSADKGIAAHEVRSGINSEIQSCSSDVNLLAAMDTQDECDAKKVDAKIFMLVHDSIVAIVKIEDVPAYREIITRNTKRDHGCSIPGFAIGTDIEIGDDYSFGKFNKTYYVEDGCLIRTADVPKPAALDMGDDEDDDQD